MLTAQRRSTELDGELHDTTQNARKCVNRLFFKAEVLSQRPECDPTRQSTGDVNLSLRWPIAESRIQNHAPRARALASKRPRRKYLCKLRSLPL
jgi:hypothetical protein